MANLPLRQLGGVGVITDASPYDLPPNAFSSGNNVIFSEGRIQRAPVFKRLFSPIRSTLSYDAAAGTYDANANLYNSAEGGSSNASRFVGSYTDPIAGETVFVADNDGTIRAYPGNVMSFQTPTTGTVTNDNPWTHAQVAGLSILARKGMRPYARNIKNDTLYSLMGGDWVSTDTASIARGFKGYAIMLGVNKNGTDYPTMVKWSNPLQYSTAVSGFQWDPANTNYVAGENIIGDMKTPIRDGMALGEAFVIYSQNQLWLMEYSGDLNVFNFRRLPFEGGILNANCVVEVESKHFVFGSEDIYVHDGISRQSIADGRVRRRIFNTLDRNKQTACFVAHDSVSKLLHFCYATLQDEASFAGTAFCNQAATYNYKNDTWSFVDLPNIVGATEANASLVSNSFPSVTNSYTLYNTSYSSFSGGGTPKLSIMLGIYDQSKGLSDSAVYAVDLPTVGLVNLPANTETLKPAYVERVGISLDTQGLPLRSYKTVQCAVPESFFDDSTGTFTFEFGSSDLPEQTPNYRSKATFNPASDYKIDMMVSGRYLSYKISTPSISNFQVSGMDVEVKSLSKR
ncbi:hypothetical protein AWB76_07206 [Caballeronia temeraria]|uniref:Uncharacterized protein n=1 Tax=Caballeronia temeraria TaxID=1777137 RepID=A0A158DMK2_9BURK|nr:hypothetical protein [Caballeronia temeraria]SAK95839.1 hypothetical protein AWB76_07206 [Caballeronia temeraria]